MTTRPVMPALILTHHLSVADAAREAKRCRDLADHIERERTRQLLCSASMIARGVAVSTRSPSVQSEAG